MNPKAAAKETTTRNHDAVSCITQATVSAAEDLCHSKASQMGGRGQQISTCSRFRYMWLLQNNEHPETHTSAGFLKGAYADETSKVT